MIDLIYCYDAQEVILDTFFEVLKIKTPDWYNTFLEGRRLTSE
jgi:rapamycin-insensitive companion of mTOR